jgi:TP901 family phage tail tape measure protein
MALSHWHGLFLLMGVKMPDGFIIPAKVRVSVDDLSQVTARIKNGIGNVNAKIGVNIDSNAVRSVQNLQTGLSGLNSSLGTVNKSALLASQSIRALGGSSSVSGLKTLDAQLATTSSNINKLRTSLNGGSSEIANFASLAGVSARRFLAFGAVASVVYSVIAATKEGVTEAAKFQRELVRIEQVGGDSKATIRDLANEISNLSKNLGVSGNELAETATTLRQAGLSASETKEALGALAKTSLAPTFKDIKNTTEGVIALRQQFGISGSEIESALGGINTVSAQFAVESEDLVQAIQRTGGAFRAASHDTTPLRDQFNQLIGLFTSVRQTTRESAESIATSFRTIFARLQTNTVSNNLKELGVNLRFTGEEARQAGQDIEGQFVGGYEAVKRLSAAVRDIPTTDPRFASIVSQIGGTRQVSKVIPLLQQFSIAQKAVNVAQAGSTSLTRDADKAQESFLNKVSKLKSEFNDLVRVFSNNKGLNAFVDFALKGASAAISFTKALEPLLPLVIGLAAVKLGSASRIAVPNFARGFATGSVAQPKGFATGGIVPGYGSGDKVPANAKAGDFIIKKSSARKFGYGNLHNLVDGRQGFADGGTIPVMLEPKEYYIPKEQAQRIGYNKLKYLNQTGHLPGNRVNAGYEIRSAASKFNNGYASGGEISYLTKIRNFLSSSSRLSDGSSIPRSNYNKLINGPLGDDISSVVGHSDFLASGTDAVAFKNNENNVIRIGGLGHNQERYQNFLANGGRPKDNFTLQPLTSQKIGQHLVETLPLAQTLTNQPLTRQKRIARAFEKRLFANGLVPTDTIPENLGRYNKKIVAIDAETYKTPSSPEEFSTELSKRFRNSPEFESIHSSGLKAAGYAGGGFIHEPNPIDTNKLLISRFGNNGGRSRRYSLDSARSRYYAKNRSARFSDALQTGRVNDHINLLETRFAKYQDKKSSVVASAGYAEGGEIPADILKQLSSVFGDKIDFSKIAKFNAAEDLGNKAFGTFNPQDRTVSIRSDKLGTKSLIGHEFTHAADYSAGLASGKDSYASTIEGHKYEELARRAESLIYNQIKGRRSLYDKQGVTDHRPEAFAALGEQYTKFKTGGGKNNKLYENPDVVSLLEDFGKTFQENSGVSSSPRVKKVSYDARAKRRARKVNQRRADLGLPAVKAPVLKRERVSEAEDIGHARVLGKEGEDSDVYDLLNASRSIIPQTGSRIDIQSLRDKDDPQLSPIQSQAFTYDPEFPKIRRKLSGLGPLQTQPEGTEGIGNLFGSEVKPNLAETDPSKFKIGSPQYYAAKRAAEYVPNSTSVKDIINQDAAEVKKKRLAGEPLIPQTKTKTVDGNVEDLVSTADTGPVKVSSGLGGRFKNRNIPQVSEVSSPVIPIESTPVGPRIRPDRFTDDRVQQAARLREVRQNIGATSLLPIKPVEDRVSGFNTEASPVLTPNQKAAKDFYASNPEKIAADKKRERVRGKTVDEHNAADEKKRNASSTFRPGDIIPGDIQPSIYHKNDTGHAYFSKGDRHNVVNSTNVGSAAFTGFESSIETTSNFPTGNTGAAGGKKPPKPPKPPD